MLNVKNIKVNLRRRNQRFTKYHTVFQRHLHNTLETTQTLNFRDNLISVLRKHWFSVGNYFVAFLKLNFSREFHPTNCAKWDKCRTIEIKKS